MEMHDFITLERRYWTEGPGFYRQRTTPDCIMVFPGLGAVERDAAIAGLEGGPRWTDVELSGTKLMAPVPGMAILTYLGQAHRDDDDEPYRAFVSSIYVQDAQSWKLAFHQQTAAD